jgi:hypothetical protein
VTPAPRLLTITAYARSGALEHAWRLFREAGFEAVDDDPAVLSVRGRLLKDRALEARRGPDRRRLYLEAAQAYARSGALGGRAYPLINAATLSLLAGRPGKARELARQVLALPEDEQETPYYRGATRAEALLVLGEVEKARLALAEAMGRAPRAFEDHASTLRQFALVLEALGEDAGWLDPLRPPRALHFAGHMGLDGEEAGLRRRIDQALAADKVGYGYGALAAGADILIAEALLERGAELHLILPAPPDLFLQSSVAGFGPGWPGRFSRLLEAADGVRAVGAGFGPPGAAAIRLAQQVAMGEAVMQAQALATEAVQLLLIDPEAAARGEGEATSEVAAAWRAAGRRQRLEPAPRRDAGPRSAPARGPEAPAALLRIEPPDVSPDQLAAAVLPALAGALQTARGLLAAPRWTGEAVHAAFAGPAEAASAALAAAAALAGLGEPRISADYALARLVEDPFGAAPMLLGPALRRTREIALSTPPGAIHVSEDFAAALHAGPARDRPRAEYVGELPQEDPAAAVRLYALKP